MVELGGVLLSFLIRFLSHTSEHRILMPSLRPSRSLALVKWKYERILLTRCKRKLGQTRRGGELGCWARKAGGGHRAHTEWRQLATVERLSVTALWFREEWQHLWGAPRTWDYVSYYGVMHDHSYDYLEDKSQRWSLELIRQGQDSTQVPQSQSPGPRECAPGPPCLSREDSRAVITLSIFPRNQYQECHKPSWSSAGWKTELNTG